MTSWTVRDMMNNERVSPVARMEWAFMSRLGVNVYNTKADGIPEGRIEYFLWEWGYCAVWKHPVMGWICSPAEPRGYDHNGFPNRWHPVQIGKLGDIKYPDEIMEGDTCVIFRDTTIPGLRRSDVLLRLEEYGDVRETINTQIFNQKTPMIAVCGSQGAKAKLKNAIVQIGHNVKALFVDGEDIKDSFTQLDLNPVYNVESLYKYSRAIENEMLQYIGIDSQDAFMKKERLVVDEQEGNDELLNYLLADGLKVRKDACERLTAIGVNATSEIQKLVRPLADETVVDDDRETETQ